MLPRKPKLVAFDLDGTLVDSAPDLAFAVDAMLARLGRPKAGEDKVKDWIGNGVGMLVRRALTFEPWPESDPPEFAEALPLFMDLYGENLCNRSRLFPGVLEGVRQLKAEGYLTTCATNKVTRFTLPLLEQLGLAPHLDFIGCGDQFAHHKPHPEPLLKTAARFGLDPADCLMVGDSANDVTAARAAGFMVLCVPYGYSGGVPVEQLEPDGIVASLADLPALCGAA
jgi:phosphoglycolate phosphatase